MESIENIAYSHYNEIESPIEFQNFEECAIDIRNIGWTLGNECPYRCSHCYSMSARKKGQDLSKDIVNRVVNQLLENGVETVNLGGNEPIYTNGKHAENSLLPYIIECLHDAGIDVGLTTSGISLIKLKQYFPKVIDKLNDIDVSLDSPFEEEHNRNRGAKLYKEALMALDICNEYEKEHSIIMCGMSWNFSIKHLAELKSIAIKTNSNIRINPLKPVEAKHMESILTEQQYFEGFEYLLNNCEPIDLGEPPLATLSNLEGAKGCPCGRTSFRIHSITPDGKIPISPCVYLHDFKVGNLLTDELYDIVRSPQFRTFRIRNQNTDLIPECNGCELSKSCRGGCSARAYLHNLHETGTKSLFKIDPYCPKKASNLEIPQKPKLPNDIVLVHRDYLCTWIGKPKSCEND